MITRRDFLKGITTLAGYAAATGGLIAFPKVGSALAGNRSPDEIFKSTCVQCVNFCGIEVHKQGDVIRSIFPDSARRDYYNHGICPKGVSGIFSVYNPYRVKVPLKRTNPLKGMDQDPKWVAISWEEAFQTLTERLDKIRKDNPSKLIWQHGHGKYLIGDQFPKAFCKVFGTPNVIHRTTSCESARHVADDMTWGYHGFLPDVEHCNLLLVFGSNYFEAEQYARWLDHAVTDAHERGMKVVAVEPRFSHVAAKADQWIPVRPGKDVVILLALSGLLIESGAIDADFLITYTNAPQLVGDDGKVLRNEKGEPLVWDSVTQAATVFAEGVVPALRGSHEVGDKKARTAFDVFADSLKEITPDYAAEVAGVSAETIRQLAVDIARAARIGETKRVGDLTHRYRPVMVHTWRGLSAKEHGVQTWRAGLLLQMLIGNPDAVGGMVLGKVYDKPEYMEPAKCEYPPKRVDLAKSVYFPNGHHDVCQQVALTMLDPAAYGLPYVPEMQIFYATNRPVSTSDTATQFRSLEKTYNVVIEVHMSEVAWMADMVLPDLTYLESWHLSPTRWTPTTKHTAIRQPVANVYGIQHDAYDVLWELAKRLDLRDAYIAEVNNAWKLKEHVFQPGRDYSAREAVEVIWADKTKGEPFETALKHGFIGKKVKPADTYLKGVEAQFKGPGKPKMMFYADQMTHTLDKLRKTVSEKGVGNIDLDQYAIAYSPIPTKDHAFPTPHREATDLPFYLITFKRMYRNQMACHNTNPILNQALGKGIDDNRVLMNTAAGTGMGIKDGDEVIVETRVGKVKGRVQLTEGIRPDTLGISYHYGQSSPGFPAYARKGIDVNSVLELHPDRISGMNSYNDTKCNIYPA